MRKLNIGIITFPISEAGNVPLSNLVDILYPLSDDIYLITGNDGYTFFKEDIRISTYGVRHKSGNNVITRILKFICTQLRISYQLAKVAKNVDLWIFFTGGQDLLLPMLTAKLLRNKVVLAFVNSSVLCLKSANDSFFKPVEILSKINCTLSDGIVLCSENLVKDWNLEKYRDKISIAYEHFLDFGEFKMEKKFDERDNLVGYMGRLSEEKGVLNFVRAITLTLKQRNDLKFLIGGDGQLRDQIEKYLEKKDLNDKIKFMGWVPHDKVPEYLNELKLLVVPSYTESGPLIALEAMSCGTPILATPVGHILNIVEDGETGFIMEDNSPECIAKNVIRGLGHPNLDEISKNARVHMEKEFTYDAAVEKYLMILKKFDKER